MVGPHPAVRGESEKAVSSRFCFRMKALCVYRAQLDSGDYKKRGHIWGQGGPELQGLEMLVGTVR